MTRIAIKRVYEPATDTDGLRVLVDKLWPRGIRKEALHYDLWAKEIAPSAPLRRWFHADPQGRWEEFRRRYLHELAASPDRKSTRLNSSHVALSRMPSSA